jgi:hypothetical protein
MKLKLGKFALLVLFIIPGLPVLILCAAFALMFPVLFGVPLVSSQRRWPVRPVAKPTQAEPALEHFISDAEVFRPRPAALLDLTA